MLSMPHRSPGTGGEDETLGITPVTIKRPSAFHGKKARPVFPSHPHPLPSGGGLQAVRAPKGPGKPEKRQKPDEPVPREGHGQGDDKHSVPNSERMLDSIQGGEIL